MPHLLTLSPDATLLLLTAGVLLIYLELNCPGAILPGAAGLTFALLAVAHFLRSPLNPSAATACLLAFALLAVSTSTRAHVPLAVLATAALLYAFLNLAPTGSNAQPYAYVAIPCALLLGVGTSFLTTIAARARQNKSLGGSPEGPAPFRRMPSKELL